VNLRNAQKRNTVTNPCRTPRALGFASLNPTYNHQPTDRDHIFR